MQFMVTMRRMIQKQFNFKIKYEFFFFICIFCTSCFFHVIFYTFIKYWIQFGSETVLRWWKKIDWLLFVRSVYFTLYIYTLYYDIHHIIFYKRIICNVSLCTSRVFRIVEGSSYLDILCIPTYVYNLMIYEIRRRLPTIVMKNLPVIGIYIIEIYRTE